MNLNELLEPNAQKAVFTFGRFNPPTKGHARLMDVVKNASSGADHYVFTGKTNDPKKNPLQYKDKITFLRAMFPHMNIMDDPNIRTPWEALEELGKQYNEVIMVVGSDRKQDFETQMRPYLKDFGIEKFSIVSSGERDADATDVSGVSASKARALAKAGDFKSFSQTIDGGEKLKQQLYYKVRQGMGIQEQVQEDYSKMTRELIIKLIKKGKTNDEIQSRTGEAGKRIEIIRKSLEQPIKVSEMANKPKMPKNPEIKKRDPNWKDMEALRKSGAAGTHKDKKALDKRGYEKHKGKSYDINESIDWIKLRNAKAVMPYSLDSPEQRAQGLTPDPKSPNIFTSVNLRNKMPAGYKAREFSKQEVSDESWQTYMDKTWPELKKVKKDQIRKAAKLANLPIQEKSLSVNEANGKPIVYVDMDGVLANFFAEYAKLAGVKSGNYKDIPPAKTDPTLDKMIGTDFFDRLPKFPTTDKLIQLVVKEFGSYKILSSPLRGDHENSKVQKIKWIKRELAIQPEEIIVVGRKDSYAVQADGTQNILIDDRGRNIQGWLQRGGYGVKYQADEDPLSKVVDGIKDFKEKNNLTEWGGRVVKGINTTPDVGVDAIKKQSAKFGFKVTKDGVPPILAPKNLRRVKRMQEALIKINGANKDLTLKQQMDLLEVKKGISKILKATREVESEVPYQNQGGDMSLLTHPGTEMFQKMKLMSKPGTDDWFKTWRTLSYLTKGRKNHYMLPVKEQLEKLLIKYGMLKEAPGDEEKINKKNLLGLRQEILDKLESLPQTKDARRTLEKVRELLQATDATDNLKAYAERITDLGAQDNDVAGAVEQLTKLIGAVVQMTSVKDKNLFFKLWESDRLVKVDKLMKGGEVMNLSELFSYYGRSKAVTYVVNSLSKDAGYGLGKGEFLLAVLSRRIQKAPGKGDLLIDGKSIEVKATDGGSPRFADQEVRVAQGYEQTRDQLFDLYKEEIAQIGGAGKTGLNLDKWVQVGQQTTVDKPTFAKNTKALLSKIFPDLDNTALANSIAAGQLGKAKSLYANSSFTRYMKIKQDEAVLYINLSKKDPTYVMFRTVEDLANMGLRLHADTIYILGMSGNRDVYPQMSVKASQ